MSTNNDTNIENETSALIRNPSTCWDAIDAAALVVNKRGAVLKNRNGPLAPENHLFCTLKKMTFTADVVKMTFAAGECCDMDAAIVLATCASPSVTLIQTWSGKKQDTVYAKTEQGWQSLRPHLPRPFALPSTAEETTPEKP
jgi:hypothetical protein